MASNIPESVHEDDSDIELELDYSSDSSDEQNVDIHADINEENDDDAVLDYEYDDRQVQFGLYEPLAVVEDNEGLAQAAVAAPEQQINEDRLQNTNWCTCGHCVVMDSFNAGDCVCCQEIPEVCSEAERHEAGCITTVESFGPAILNPISLYIGWHEYTDRWRAAARAFNARTNEKYRYVAYRKLVRWCWGWLGRDIRVQTPACAHSRIMRTYPDNQERYRGTILRPLDVD